MIKAYKFKIKPNEAQQKILNQSFGCARFVYNWGLQRKTTMYKECGKNLTYVELAKELTLLKRQEDTKWLNECTSVCLQQALRNLDVAFTAFFRKKAKYPVFKTKKRTRDSIRYIDSVHFDFNLWKVKLPKIGWVTMCKNKQFNQLTSKQGAVTVSKDKCNTYWVSVVVDDLQPKQSKAKIIKKTTVGIDLGLKHFAVLSDGTKYDNPKYYEKNEKKLARLQKAFSRTKDGSMRHEKARMNIAKCCRDIANLKSDFLHKLTSDLIKRFDTICLEDLNIDGLLQNHHLAKSIQSVSWGEFIRQLTYKADIYGKNIVYIGRYDPSSKLCNKCGYINNSLTLSVREWVCPKCGTHHDRDVNAAINIKNIALEKQNLIGIK